MATFVVLRMKDAGVTSALLDIVMSKRSDPEEARLGAERASVLFATGMDSLRTFLPLYDTGSGSIYDLRHVGLRSAPNIARYCLLSSVLVMRSCRFFRGEIYSSAFRWDYHAVHVYLLKWLVQITGDKMLNETAERWIAYSWGRKAKHN